MSSAKWRPPCLSLNVVLALMLVLTRTFPSERVEGVPGSPKHQTSSALCHDPVVALRNGIT